MESEAAILALAALAQPTRLETFRLLVRHDPAGLPAGEIADALAVPANTMSAHLGVLSRAGLISSERRSRSIIFSPASAISAMRETSEFITAPMRANECFCAYSKSNSFSPARGSLN